MVDMQVVKPTEFEIERFVVFLDIMGFKERVARTPFDELYHDLSAFSSDITTIINEQANPDEVVVKGDDESSSVSKKGLVESIEYAQFSDSIILFSNDCSDASLNKISLVAVKIMQSATKNGIPLKGAIAQGKVFYDKQKQLYFGQALIDAYQLEENVKYYGIVVHHSAEKSVKELGKKDKNFDLYQDTEVALKSGNIKHYDLMWYKKDIDSEIVKGQLDAIRLTVSDSPRIYIDNTLKLINKEPEKNIKYTGVIGSMGRYDEDD